MSKSKSLQEQIDDARQSLLEKGSTEFDLREKQPGLKSAWENLQKLKAEMYEAVNKASEEAAAPFQEEIEKLEKRYLLLLKMSA